MVQHLKKYQRCTCILINNLQLRNRTCKYVYRHTTKERIFVSWESQSSPPPPSLLEAPELGHTTHLTPFLPDFLFAISSAFLQSLSPPALLHGSLGICPLFKFHKTLRRLKRLNVASRTILLVFIRITHTGSSVQYLRFEVLYIPRRTGGYISFSLPFSAADFVPIDLEEWWAQRFLANIVNLS